MGILSRYFGTKSPIPKIQTVPVIMGKGDALVELIYQNNNQDQEITIYDRVFDSRRFEPEKIDSNYNRPRSSKEALDIFFGMRARKLNLFVPEAVANNNLENPYHSLFSRLKRPDGTLDPKISVFIVKQGFDFDCMFSNAGDIFFEKDSVPIFFKDLKKADRLRHLLESQKQPQPIALSP